MNRLKRLSETFVKTVNRPGRYGDGRGGNGLSLLVKPMSTGRRSKTWSQRLRINGDPSNIGLGAIPVVTLAEARAAALANRRMVAQGTDPRHKSEEIPTFARAVETVIAIHQPTWKMGARTGKIWRSSLGPYAMPRLGRKPVDRITTSDVLAVLVPIWNTKRETARRVRQRIGAVMKWAVAEGHREDNPAGDAIGAALPKTGARWDEIEGDTWIVPGDRMKAGRPRRVPLSGRALEVLNEARAISDGTGLVFPSVRGKVLSDSTISKLTREHGIPAVPPGSRLLTGLPVRCATSADRCPHLEWALDLAARGVHRPRLFPTSHRAYLLRPPQRAW